MDLICKTTGKMQRENYDFGEKIPTEIQFISYSYNICNTQINNLLMKSR